MKTISEPIIFFGSGPVAAKSLELINKWADIQAVVTKPKPLHHKDPAPVEQFTNNNGIKTFFAANKLELDDLIKDGVLPQTKLAVLIDFGVIVSQQVIDYFDNGIINSHFSVLPEWRGADPISYALLSGQKFTGVSLMLIDKGMDTGLILSQQKTEILDYNNQDLTNQLIMLSNSMLKHDIPKYLSGSLKPQQQEGLATYSRMLAKQDGIIDVNKPAAVIVREIRALQPWPGSRCEINGMWLTLISATASERQVPKGVLEAYNKSLYLGCKVGSIKITELKPAGKKNMSATAFINGYAHLINN